MTEKVFVPAYFFLLRIPAWPIGNSLNSPLDIYSGSEQLREAIAIASPTLYAALKNRASKNLNQEAKSLSHYISRMMVRPTPFGLFSSVSTAKWGETTNIYFDDRFLRKRTRLDMEWVYLLIQKIYQEETNFLLLPVRSNPLLKLSGERYHLDYLRHLGKESDSQNKSIRGTPLIQLILDHAKTSISVNQLWLKLQADFPILEQDKTLAVIRQLFSQQFLLPCLLPSLLSSSTYESLAFHFPEIRLIFEEMKNYNELPPGKGEEALEKLQGKMASIISNKNYLQVDMAYEGKNLELSKQIVEELEKALNLLWKMACIKKKPTELAAYHSKFLEKYGEYRTVPLLEMLDEEKGLGTLFENPIPSSTNEWEKWLYQQWQECIFDRKKEWVLTEESIDPFLKTVDPKEAPLSLDLFCKVFADSHQNIDLGKFLLVLGDITKEGGSVFGRFLDLLGSDTQAKLAEFFTLEERLEEKSLFVELSYLPSAVRSGNVVMHSCLRSNRLDIEADRGQEGALSLEDIYVGATPSKFYLTDKESKFSIVTRANHLFNSFYDPSPLKFMRAVTHSQSLAIPHFSWGAFQEAAVYLPRVRFGKTVLAQATWNVDPKPYMKETLEKNRASFNSWADKWDLPLCFFMVQGDQHLLLDRGNPNHIDEVLTKLKKGESLKFIEKMEGAWIRGNGGNHFCEISVPFVKNKIYAREEKPLSVASYSPLTENREKFPGSDWLYLKLYMSDEKMNEFLVGYLYDFIEGFRQEGTIKEWFYVRYRDPEPHLRLRIHALSFEMICRVLFALEDQLKLWTHLGWIRDVSIGKYEKEIERYGGPSLIEAAETVFFQDAISALHIIHSSLTKQVQCEAVVLHTISIINFLRSFGKDLHQMLSFLNQSAKDESELKGFRQYKSQLIILIKGLEQENCEIPEIQVMSVAFQVRSESVQNFCQLATHLEQEQFDSLLESLLHMHCNRLGCLGKGETKAKLYARQALLSILNKESASLDVPINQVVRK